MLKLSAIKLHKPTWRKTDGGKVPFFRRKTFTAAVALLAVAAIFFAVTGPTIVGAAAASRQLPIYCVQRDAKMVSLTFDAAWGKCI